MLTNLIFLDEAAAQSSGGGFGGIIMIVVLIAIFYFFMIRPQQKKQKEIRKFRQGLAVGNKVVTAGGIYGKIRNINAEDNTVQVEIADGVKILVDLGSVYPSAEKAAQAAGEAQK